MGSLFSAIACFTNLLIIYIYSLFFSKPDNAFLDFFDPSSESAHPVFGKVTDNYDLVVRISQVPTRNDNPIRPIRMVKVRVVDE